jgi:tetratricopeptide (TPR) repeat protein
VRRGRLLAAALALVAALGGTRAARAQDRADSAWNAGATALAESLYAQRLAADSNDQRALHRLALIFAWSGRYAPSVALFDRLVAIAPENVEARRDRARVLSWKGDLRASADAYAAILTQRPADRATALGLAQVLSWSNRLDSSSAVYRALLQRDPGDREALKGLARVRSWSGDLRGAEASWRDAVAADGADAEARAGLAQVLRWQGRLPAAAREVAALPGPAHDSADARREQREVGAAIGPRTSGSATHERDSDGNRILTLAAAAGWRPLLPVDAVVSGYRRWTSVAGSGFADRTAAGVRLDARVTLDPGWALFGGVGRSWSDAPGAPGHTSWSVGAATPARQPLGLSVTLSRVPLDASVLLIDRGVVVSDLSLTARFEPVSPWSASLTASRATFEGTAPNRRLLGTATLTRRLPGRWAAGAVARAFGFQHDLGDGYFDPDFYGLAEAFLRWRPVVRGWEVSVEAAPGLQQVGSGGKIGATARAGGRMSRPFGPGREIGLGALFMTTGIQSFATGAANYRYFAVTLSGSWSFGRIR